MSIISFREFHLECQVMALDNLFEQSQAGELRFNGQLYCVKLRHGCFFNNPRAPR